MNNVLYKNSNSNLIIENDGKAYKLNEYANAYNTGGIKPNPIGTVRDGHNKYILSLFSTGADVAAICKQSGVITPIASMQQNTGFNNNSTNGFASAGFNNGNSNMGNVSGHNGDIYNGSVSLHSAKSMGNNKSVEDVLRSTESTNTKSAVSKIPPLINTMTKVFPETFEMIDDNLILVKDYNSELYGKLISSMVSNDGNTLTPIPTTYDDHMIKYAVVNNQISYKNIIQIKKDGNNMDENKHKAVYETLANKSVNLSKLSKVSSFDGVLNLNDSLLPMMLDMIVSDKEFTIVPLSLTAGYFIHKRPLTTVGELTAGNYLVEETNNLVRNQLWTNCIINSTDLKSLVSNLLTIEDKYLSKLDLFVGKLVKETIGTIDPTVFDIIPNNFSCRNDLPNIIEGLNGLLSGDEDSVTFGRVMKLGIDRLYKRLTNNTPFDIIGHYGGIAKDSEIECGGITETYMGICSKDPNLEIELRRLIGLNNTDIFEITDRTPILMSLTQSIFEGSVELDNNTKFDITDYSDMRYVFILIIKDARFKIVKTINNKLVIYKEQL